MTAKFLQLVEKLRRKHNNKISYASIARRIGIDGQKITDMKRGASSADHELIDKLLIAYPELKESEPKQDDKNLQAQYEALNAKVEAGFEELKKIIVEMTVEQRAKFEAEVEKQLGDQIRELEERLDKKAEKQNKKD